MIAAVRNEEMLRFIREQELCTIAELTNRFKVSKATIHRVLNDLDAAGQVRRDDHVRQRPERAVERGGLRVRHVEESEEPASA